MSYTDDHHSDLEHAENEIRAAAIKEAFHTAFLSVAPAMLAKLAGGIILVIAVFGLIIQPWTTATIIAAAISGCYVAYDLVRLGRIVWKELGVVKNFANATAAKATPKPVDDKPVPFIQLHAAISLTIGLVDVFLAADAIGRGSPVPPLAAWIVPGILWLIALAASLLVRKGLVRMKNFANLSRDLRAEKDTPEI